MALSFLQAATISTDTSSYTYAAQNLGTPAADRMIVVCITARKAGATTTIIGVTIGGVAATVVQRSNTVTNTSVAAIAYAVVPTDTAGDIVITFGGTMVRSAIGVYRADNLASTTPFDSDNSVAADPSVALDVPYGCAVGCVLTGTAASGVAWTGLTEDYDVLHPEGSNRNSFASQVFSAQELGRTILADFASATESAGIFASWAFASSSFVPRVVIL